MWEGEGQAMAELTDLALSVEILFPEQLSNKTLPSRYGILNNNTLRICFCLSPLYLPLRHIFLGTLGARSSGL